ncbi:hypothetical protein AB0C84_46225 [Actinomadura sp. NPDC048955]|uniref:hypothetical protein n=1 Tax=Actinomadura sp. NPDC048955 TaxID=3158228 RepID=UPI0033DA2143
MWLITAFGGDAKATPVLRAVLAEAYTDPTLTERVRRRLQSRDPGIFPNRSRAQRIKIID